MTTARDAMFWAGWAAWVVWGGIVMALLAGAPNAQSPEAAMDAGVALARVAAPPSDVPAL